MKRHFIFILIAVLGLTACEAPEEQLGADGLPLPKVYRIGAGKASEIQFGMLDSINALRAASGASEVKFSPILNAAASTHARDMHVQNRPWHFGSDGSSPIDRVARLGYSGTMLGENISETYETEVETLSAWMAQEDTRNIILDKRANEFGFSWYQDNTGKLWWVMLMGQVEGESSDSAFE